MRPLASWPSCIRLPIHATGPATVWRRCRRVIPWILPGKSISTHRCCDTSGPEAGNAMRPVLSWYTASVLGSSTVVQFDATNDAVSYTPRQLACGTITHGTGRS